MTIERQTFSPRLRFGKWAGLYLGLIAASGDQQIVTNTIFGECPEWSRELVLTVGAVCTALALLGAIVSWRARGALPDDSNASTVLLTDRFIATLSAIFALVCVLVIVFGTTAGLILECERF